MISLQKKRDQLGNGQQGRCSPVSGVRRIISSKFLNAKRLMNRMSAGEISASGPNAGKLIHELMATS